MAKYDDMSFSKAFASARKEKGAGKTFTWKGKSYTTNYKEEEKKSGPTRPRRRPAQTTPSSSPRPKPRPSMTSSTSKGPSSRPRVGPRKSTTRSFAPKVDKTDDARAAATRAGTSSILDSQKLRRENITMKQWEKLSRPERRRLGLPVSPIGMSVFLAKRSKKPTTGSRARKSTR